MIAQDPEPTKILKPKPKPPTEVKPVGATSTSRVEANINALKRQPGLSGLAGKTGHNVPRRELVAALAVLWAMETHAKDLEGASAIEIPGQRTRAEKVTEGYNAIMRAYHSYAHFEDIAHQLTKQPTGTTTRVGSMKVEKQESKPA